MSLSPFRPSGGHGVHVQAERNDPAYERERIDELTVFIEGNLLDELDELGCVEGFCLNAKAGLERGFPKLEEFKKTWCTAAARRVVQVQPLIFRRENRIRHPAYFQFGIATRESQGTHHPARYRIP